MRRMIIFDDGLGQLGPMADLRASFEIRTGMLTTGRRIDAHRPRTLAGYWVPERLRALVSERANAPVNFMPEEEEVYLVNGRWAMPDARYEQEINDVVVEEATGHVIAAVFRRADAEYFLRTGQLHERASVRKLPQRVLYRYPWDVMAAMQQTIPHDLMSTHMETDPNLGDHTSIVGEFPVDVASTARVWPNVVFDAEKGPIKVHDRAVIRPGAVLCGPCSIGHDSVVIDRAHIKAHTVLGPHCKVGGEVGATIFQGFSNKVHDGHLGDSWVGRWVNFGAGTTNSNLLNTYGEVTVRLEPEGQRFRTGRQFLGAIIGDHVKFAILTRIMTGSVIGTGAMIATTAPPPTTVRRFAWLTDDGERTFKLDRFLETARAVMERRHVQASEAYENALRELHARFVAEKQPQ